MVISSSFLSFCTAVLSDMPKEKFTCLIHLKHDRKHKTSYFLIFISIWWSMYSTWAHLGFNALTCAQPKSRFQKIYGKGDLWTALKCKLTSFTALEVLTLYELYIIMYQPATKLVNYFLKARKRCKKGTFFMELQAL